MTHLTTESLVGLVTTLFIRVVGFLEVSCDLTKMQIYVHSCLGFLEVSCDLTKNPNLKKKKDTSTSCYNTPFRLSAETGVHIFRAINVFRQK